MQVNDIYDIYACKIIKYKEVMPLKESKEGYIEKFEARKGYYYYYYYYLKTKKINNFERVSKVMLYLSVKMRVM